VWESVVALLADPGLVRAELERRLAQMRDTDPLQGRRERLDHELAAVDAAINRLVGAYQEDLVTLEELRDRVPKLRARRHQVQGRLDTLAAQLVDQQAYLKLTENLESFLSRLHENARTTSIRDRQRVLRAVVKEVRIGAHQITIKHSIPASRTDSAPSYLLRCRSARLADLPPAGGRRPARPAEPDLQRGDHLPDPAGLQGPRCDPPGPSAPGPAARTALPRLRLPQRRPHRLRTADLRHRPGHPGSRQARAQEGFAAHDFTIDWENRRAVCPAGKTSTTWNPNIQDGIPKTVVSFDALDCIPCSYKKQCTSARRNRRQLSPRARQRAGDWNRDHALRAGVEGTIRGATHTTGLRRARYRGRAKTHLDHSVSATALNLVRLHAWWNGHPLDRANHSHLAGLQLNLTA
jgi:hypothetical protein